MAGISVSGLISNSFDWKSVVDQLIQIDSTPIARMQTEESRNVDKLSVLSALETKINDLQTAVQALSADSLFKGRTAASSTSGSTWTASAADLAATGTYKIAVTQLATAARWIGSTGIASPLSATDDVSSLTMGSIATSTPISEGSFSVNGHQVTFTAADHLADVFTRISDATGGVVTASYSTADDKITLHSNDGSAIILGASNDSSNFLAATRLSSTNPNEDAVSASRLGAVSQYAKLVDSRLLGSFGAVDGSGNGQFAVNGVTIDYNVQNDTLAAVLSRITASTAGVTATYDGANNRVVLTNKKTGDMAIGVSDTTGSLLGALGLTTAGAAERGNNALFRINDSLEQLSSQSNTLDPTTHGVTGLSVTVNSTSTETVNVSVNTAAMKAAIKTFIEKFNAVQSYIDAETKITKSADGKVSASIMAGNREMQAWGAEMRDLVSAQVGGLSSTMNRLEKLGIDFTAFQAGMEIKTWSAASDQLVIRDEARLDAALANSSSDVAALFNTASTGLASSFKAYLSTRFSASHGALDAQKDQLNKQNTSLETQIATLNRRLVSQRELLTASFLAMQTAQSQAQQQQTTLTNFLKSMSSSSS